MVIFHSYVSLPEGNLVGGFTEIFKAAGMGRVELSDRIWDVLTDEH